jgi:hypothetical protein
MKVRVLKSKTGRIIATFEPQGSSEATLEPQVSRGQKVEEVDVPQGYIDQLDMVYKKKTPARKKSR